MDTHTHTKTKKQKKTKKTKKQKQNKKTKQKKQTNKHTCKWRQKLILIEVAKWDMLIEGIIKNMISNREYTNSKEYM